MALTLPRRGGAPRGSALDAQVEQIMKRYSRTLVAGRIAFEPIDDAATRDDRATVGGYINSDLTFGYAVWVSPECPFPQAAFEAAVRSMMENRMMEKGTLTDERT